MKKMSLQLIYGIVRAAERCGGISGLEMPGRKKKWRNCVGGGHLWFNNRKTHSTGIVRLP